MFYNKDEVDKNLNCPGCGKKFESPKIVVPCFKTFCLKCIQESSVDDNFMCRACDKEHKIPEKGFEPNDVVERLLRTNYGHFSKRNLIAKEDLQENFDKFKQTAGRFVELAARIEPKIHDHCDSLRIKIDLATEEKINELNDIRKKFLKQVDNHRTSQLNRFEIEQTKIKDSRHEFDELENKCKECTEMFHVNESLADTLTKDITRKIKFIEQYNLEKFVGKEFEFKPNDTPLSDCILGTIGSNFVDPVKKTSKWFAISHWLHTPHIEIWDFGFNKIQTLGTCEPIIALVVFKERFLIGTDEVNLHVWSLSDWNHLQTIEQSYCTCLLALDDVLVGGGPTGLKFLRTACLLEKSLNTKEGLYCEKSYKRERVTCLCRAGKNRILSGNKDGSVDLWENNFLLRSFECHAGCVRALSLIDESKFLSAGEDHGPSGQSYNIAPEKCKYSLKIWGMDTQQCLYTLSGHTDRINCVVCVDNVIISGGNDCTLRFWTLEEDTYNQTKTMSYFGTPVCSIIRLENTTLLVGEQGGFTMQAIENAGITKVLYTFQFPKRRCDLLLAHKSQGDADEHSVF